MKKVIRYGILFFLGFGVVAPTKQLEITHDAEGDLKWIPVGIVMVIVTFGCGWLGRKLERWIPD